MQILNNKTSFTKVSAVNIPAIFYNRLKTGVPEMDEMFGEGILPGSASTLTADPGSGKTTFLLQLMEALSNNGYDVGYASGEENQYQLAFTCTRLNVKNIQIANVQDIDELAAAMSSFDALVIDSFQALTTKNKLNQAEIERYAVSTLIKAAKDNECALFFVMHHTKDGKLKGSSLVPHSVDVNIQITSDSEGTSDSRIISFYKNRFGPTLDYDASLGYNGFQFSGKRVVEMGKSKKTRKKDLERDILALDPPLITKPLIMEKFSLTASQAYLVLKELTDSNKLIKIGRGDDSVWKKPLQEQHKC